MTESLPERIIDSHVHFWDPSHLRYPWLDHLPINQPFLPSHFAEATAGLNVEKIIFVQADCEREQGLDEVTWITELSKTEPRIAAIVAFAPLEQGQAAAPYLDQLAANPLVKGVRRLIQSEAPGFAIAADFIHGVKLLARYDYTFDICLRHHQLAETIQLVRQCPEIPFVLDHIGKPDIKNQRLDPWRQQIETLATFPNVACKLSGLVTEADLEGWIPEELKPYIDHIIAAFGPNRVMYGSDWPVQRLASSYRRWLETVNWATAELSEAQQDRLFHDNAAAFYCW